MEINKQDFGLQQEECLDQLGPELSFIQECHPILIKYTLNERLTRFSWKPKEQAGCDFRPLGTLWKQTGDDPQYLFSNTHSSLFCFYILSRRQAEKTTSNKPLTGHIQWLDANLFDRLFPIESNSSNSPPILLIGTHDGYVYWSSLSENHKSQSSTLNLLINTFVSPVINVGTFSSVVLEENPFKAQQKQNNNINYADNCVYAVTKSGKIYVYSCSPRLQSSCRDDVTYKICIMPHFVEFAVKHSIVADNKTTSAHDYLVYSTSSLHVYALRLVDCLRNVYLKSTFVKKYHSLIRLYTSNLYPKIFTLNVFKF